MSISIGDIAYCHFTGRHGGKHFGVVIEITQNRIIVARGTSYRPWDVGLGSRWLPCSLLVDDDELEGTGLHHATRFDLELKSSEGFGFGAKSFRRIGRLPETESMRLRWLAAKQGQSRRPF